MNAWIFFALYLVALIALFFILMHFVGKRIEGAVKFYDDRLIQLLEERKLNERTS